ncbi:MAG: hypothetical protein MUE81_12660 [Thermoflexibacter sp.]|nr:hypothetical protein [Thermoflexibacter sp.]
MKKNILKFSMALILMSLLSTSCNQLRDKLGFDSNAVETDNELDRVNDDIDVIVEDASDVSTSISNGRVEEGNKFASCAKITHDKASKTVTIDFGNGCVGRDGKTRKGKIIAVHTDAFRKPNSKCTVTFENYSVEDKKIEGTVVTTYNGLNITSKMVQKTSLVNIKLTFSNGQTASRNVTITQSFNLSPNMMESEYKVTIEGTGVARNGVPFTTTTLSPITKKVACFKEKVPYPVSGVQLITPQNDKEPIRIDFGDGTCDKSVTISRGEVVKVITLK